VHGLARGRDFPPDDVVRPTQHEGQARRSEPCINLQPTRRCVW
jgi:hypothetical protein